MKKESIIVLLSVVALAACSSDNDLLSAEEVSGADDSRLNGEKNEAIENATKGSSNDEDEEDSDSVEDKTDEQETEGDSKSENDESDGSQDNGEENKDNDNSVNEEEDQVSEGNGSITPDEIIETALLAEAQLDSFALEWTFHDVAEDGTVLEARDYEILRYYANEDGVDYFYRYLTGVDEEDNPMTMSESQTPEARTLYRDVDEVVVLTEPSDQMVPPPSRNDLQSLKDDNGYTLTYEGIFEIGGYETYHINAVTEENNVEMNFWFDTDTGLQVRQNSFYAGLEGSVAILTNIETDIEFNESDYVVDAPSSVPVEDNR